VQQNRVIFSSPYAVKTPLLEDSNLIDAAHSLPCGGVFCRTAMGPQAFEKYSPKVLKNPEPRKSL